MPVTAEDIQLYYSGGPTNADPNKSLGGPISSYAVPSGQLNNLFDDVSEVESGTGDVEYRCVYIKNTNPTSSLNNVVVWIAQDTPSPDDEIDIGVDPSGINGTAIQIPDENTPPSGVAFSHPISRQTGLLLGNLGPGQHVAIWIRRTVNPGAAPFSNNNPVIGVAGVTS